MPSFAANSDSADLPSISFFIFSRRSFTMGVSRTTFFTAEALLGSSSLIYSQTQVSISKEIQCPRHGRILMQRLGLSHQAIIGRVQSE